KGLKGDVFAKHAQSEYRCVHSGRDHWYFARDDPTTPGARARFAAGYESGAVPGHLTRSTVYPGAARVRHFSVLIAVPDPVSSRSQHLLDALDLTPWQSGTRRRRSGHQSFWELCHWR